MLVAWFVYRHWRWRQYVPPKRRTSTGLQSVTSQNASRSLLWELQIQHCLRVYFPRILTQSQHPPVNENQMDSWRRIIINLDYLIRHPQFFPWATEPWEMSRDSKYSILIHFMSVCTSTAQTICLRRMIRKIRIETNKRYNTKQMSAR
jgi:hypothetical protein